MSSRATARAVEPAPTGTATDPAGFDSDLESALLAGLSEGRDELPEETGAPAPDGPAAPPNSPEPGLGEDGLGAGRDFDAEIDFGPDPAPLPEPPGTGVDDLLARLADDEENAGAGVDLGVVEVPGGQRPQLDPAPAPDVSSDDTSTEVSGFPDADRDRPPAAAERNAGGYLEYVLRAGLDADSAAAHRSDEPARAAPPGFAPEVVESDFVADHGLGGDAGPDLRSWTDEGAEGREEEAADLLSHAAAMDDEGAAADDLFPPFAAGDALADADVVEDGPVLGGVVELGDALALGDDPVTVDDPVRDAAPRPAGMAALDRAAPPGEEPARGDAAPGSPFDDAIDALAEAVEAGAAPGTDGAEGGLPTSAIGNDADAGTDSGFPAAEPETPAPLAFATDPESERALRDGLSDHPLPQVWPGDLRTAVATLGAGHAPRLLFVDLDETAYPAGAIHDLAGVCEVGTAVIAFGSNATARFSREILLAGVSDYLVKPLTAEAVREAAGAAAGVSTAGASAALPAGWSVGFTGTGGSGSTTLAAATALLTAERGRYVSVLDLDRTFPALAFLLDVEPASGLVELLSTAARASLHPEMVDAMRASRGDRIAVYGYPWSALPPPPPPVWAVCELIEELQRRSHLVIVDGLDDPATRLALLAVTDGRVLVVEPTGSGAPAAARLRDRLGPMAAPERGALVVQNHTRAFKAKAGAKALREAGMESEPEVVVPFEPTLPTVTDRGWPNDRLPKPIRKPLASLADRVLAGEQATGVVSRADTGAVTEAAAAPALARA